MASPHLQRSGVSIDLPIPPECEEVLSPEAVEFVVELHHKFNGRRKELLDQRVRRQEAIDGGQLPDFLPETESIRKSDYTVAPIPQDLMDRRVEITGPVDRKMVINALNSGANVFMADFEDSNSPTWYNNITGQVNVRDAVRGTIQYASPEGKAYKLNPTIATLVVRPRGWHLIEKHFVQLCELLPQHLSHGKQGDCNHLETRMPSHELPDPGFEASRANGSYFQSEIPQRSPHIVLQVLQLVAEQLSGGQQHSLLLARKGFHMDRLVQPHSHHPRDPASIVAVALIYPLGLENRLHMACFHADHWQLCLGQPVH